jgi:uncharacterized protein DUF4255
VSTELAITAVTATLRQVLDDEVAGKWGVDVLSGDLTKDRFITNLPLHKVRELHTSENIINLFLYRTDVNPAWRNLSPPTQGKSGDGAPPPLALNLEYLISAYGEDDREEVAHFLLGQAMRILHDVALVPRQKLFDVLKRARLHDQIERITVTPRSLSIEEISKLWSVFQTQYRVSAAYLVTVVLIDSRVAKPAPLPVLTRGPQDSGVTAIAAAPPALDAAKPASGFGAVRLGEDLFILGERLDASGVTAKVRHSFMPAARTLPVTGMNAGQLKVTLPAAAPASGVAAAWPAGIYSLWLEVTRPPQPSWATNEVPFVLAPSITVVPKSLQPPTASFEVTILATPQVHPSQAATVLFDDLQLTPKPITLPADADAGSTVKADVPGSVAGFHRVRLRVDGIDSIPMKRVGDTVVFDVDQSVEVKP